MNINKMRDFMSRLQQAHKQAADSGNHDLANQYAALADQAEPHIRAMAGPQGQAGAAGVPGGPVRTPSPGKTVGNPPAAPSQDVGPTLDMLSQPPDIKREAAQESGKSWLDKLFSGGTPNSTGSSAYAGQGGMNPAMRQQQQPVNQASMLPTMESMTTPLWGDHDLLFNQKEQTGAIQGVTNGLFGNKWFKPEVADPKKMTVPEAEKQTGWHLNSPLDPNESAGNDQEPVQDDEELGALMARNGRADVGDAAPPPEKKDPYAVLGEDPGNAGIMDILGILMGGKNYLNYKDKITTDYNNKKFAISQGLHADEQNDKYHQMANALGMSKLGVDYSKNQAEMEEKALENSDRNQRAILDSNARSLTDLNKNPEAVAAMQALKRQKQIETKKGQ